MTFGFFFSPSRVLPAAFGSLSSTAEAVSEPMIWARSAEFPLISWLLLKASPTRNRAEKVRSEAPQETRTIQISLRRTE